MSKTFIVVDIEANGPIPGDYSMTSLGAAIVDDSLDKTFSVKIKPISDKSMADREKFVDQSDAIDAKEAMQKFANWIASNVDGKPVFISDNNGFDWMFVCWYFWHFLGENPLGFNSYNMSSLYKGIKKDLEAKIEDLRERELTHIAEEDAMDNAKMLLKAIAKLSND